MLVERRVVRLPPPPFFSSPSCPLFFFVSVVKVEPVVEEKAKTEGGWLSEWMDVADEVAK